MQTMRKFLRLPWARKRTLLQAGLLLGVTRIGLSVLSFKTVQRVFAWLSKKPVRARLHTEAYRQRAIWAVRAAGKRVLGDHPCLPEALVAQYLLTRAGYASVLHIGVAKETQDQLLAHAWLESEGAIIVGGEDSTTTFAPLHPIEKQATTRILL